MYDVPIYVNAYDILLHVLFFLIFILGFYSYKSRKTKITPIYRYPPYKLIKIYKITYAITVAAYIIWFINIYRLYGSGLVFNLMHNLTGYAETFKGQTNISGITTFTELGIVVAPLNMYLWCITKKYKKNLIFLFILATLRAAIFAERLAIIELVLPSLVIYAYYGKIFRKKIIQFAPLLGILLLLLVFGSFEYFRSWEYYKESYEGNIVSFVVDRVFGYYSIAVNTECIQVNFLNAKYFFAETLGWLWQIPGFSLLPDLFMTNPKIDFLTKWGNPEFNNPGGLLFAFKDFGYFGILIQFLFGRFVAIAYRGYCRYDFISSLWYSVSFLCMLELARYFFWGSNRAFFPIIGILIIQYFLKYIKVDAKNIRKRPIPYATTNRNQ